MALASRQKSGKGQYIDVAMTDGLLSLLAVPLSFTFSGRVFPGRVSNETPEWFACYRVYRTKDGEYLSVGPLEPHLWASLCKKLGCPEYIPLQYDKEARARIVEHLERLFAAKNLAEWMEFLSDFDDCVAPVSRVRQLPEHAHFKARTMIHVPSDDIPEPGITPKLLDTPGAIRRPAYRFGEHSREILQELGCNSERIATLERAEVAWSP